MNYMRRYYLSFAKELALRYRGSPPNDHLHPTHIPSKIEPPHSKMDNIFYNDRIEFAITDLKL
jgi:hypothetical protein